MTALSPEARAALMDLAEKVSRMRDALVVDTASHDYAIGYEGGYCNALDLVLETIVKELERK